jgi:hypothetical protein
VIRHVLLVKNRGGSRYFKIIMQLENTLISVFQGATAVDPTRLTSFVAHTVSFE